MGDLKIEYPSMTKILLDFNGTWGGVVNKKFEELNPTSNTIRLYFKGCQHGKMGGNGIFPNIESIAKRIASAFSDDGKILDLEKIKNEFKDAVVIKPDDALPQIKEVDELTLTGFSRGGVTTFYVAKELHHQKKPVPVRLIAEQPVPGNYYQGKHSLVSKIMDLSDCTNIISAAVIVGSYAKQTGLTGFHALKSKFHSLFFRQVIPKFPITIEPLIIDNPCRVSFFIHRLSIDSTIYFLTIRTPWLYSR